MKSSLFLVGILLMIFACIEANRTEFSVTRIVNAPLFGRQREQHNPLQILHTDAVVRALDEMWMHLVNKQKGKNQYTFPGHISLITLIQQQKRHAE